MQAERNSVEYFTTWRHCHTHVHEFKFEGQVLGFFFMGKKSMRMNSYLYKIHIHWHIGI